MQGVRNASVGRHEAREADPAPQEVRAHFRLVVAREVERDYRTAFRDRAEGGRQQVLALGEHRFVPGENTTDKDRGH